MDSTSPDDAPGPQREKRRQHPRMKIAVEAELQSERTATPLRVKTADLSLDGFYTEMMFTLEVGAKLKIVLWLDDVIGRLLDPSAPLRLQDDKIFTPHLSRSEFRRREKALRPPTSRREFDWRFQARGFDPLPVLPLPTLH